MLERIRRQLPTIFSFLGVLALLVSGGLFLVYGDANRWVLTSAAVGIIFLVYALLERPESAREAVTSRGARHGGNAALLAVAVIGIVALLNVLAARYSYRLDLTEDQSFSLSPQTIQVLRGLESPVKITAFYQQQGPGQEEMQDLLNSYTQHTDRITYEFIDPVVRPGVAQALQIEQYPTTVLEANGRRQTVNSASEGDVTSALVKLQQGEPKKIGWITGHGELDLEAFNETGASEAKRLIELENYTIEPLALISVQEIPADVSVVVLAGPQQPLLPQEAEVLQKYLDGGGKLLVALEPLTTGNPKDLLSAWGIEVGEGIVVDLARNVQGDPFTPAVIEYEPNSIMRNVSGDTTGRFITVFPGATMVRPIVGSDQSLQVQVVGQSSAERSWLETSQPIDPRTIALDPAQDVPGPVPMITSVRKTTGTATDAEAGSSTRIVAIGDSTFMTNTLLSVVQIAGNRDLLLNSLNWLAEEEQLMSVRSQVNTDRTLILTGTEQNLLFFSSTIFLPLVVIAAGAFVWWRRR